MPTRAGFTPAPNRVIYDASVTDAEFRCYMVLLGHCNLQRDGESRTWVLNKKLADELGRSERSASRLVGQLERRGLIRVERGGGYTRLVVFPGEKSAAENAA